jgi:hypothetical protein
MHRECVLKGWGQQRVAQQCRDRFVDSLAADASNAAVVSERLKQLARDALRTKKRADLKQLLSDRLSGDLLKRQLPDGRDGVLIPDRSAGREQLRGAVTQPLQIPREPDRLRVGVGGGLLKRKRQIPQRISDGITGLRVPF